MNRRPTRIATAGVFLLALTIRLIHVGQISSAPFFDMRLGDSLSYHTWASEIANGEWLGDDVFYQAPLYPYWLACVYKLVGDERLGVVLIQSVLGALSCVFLYRAASVLISHRCGLATALIVACYAPAIFFDSLIQKSTLDLFLLSLLIWLMAAWYSSPRALHAVLLGVVTGCLVLTRENALVFVIALVVSMALQLRTDRRRAVAAVVLFAVGTASALLPVAVRNLVVGGELHLTTSQFGPNFYIGNNPDANGMYQPLSTGGGHALRERTDATRLAQRDMGRTLSPAEVSRYWTKRALEFITNDTGDWLRLMGRKQVLLWNRVEVTDTEDLYTYAEWSTLLRWLTPVSHFGVLVPLAFLGVCVTWRSGRPTSGMLLMLLIYAASVWMFYVFGRYRYPLMPLLAIFAGAAVAHGADWLKRVERRRSLSAGAAVCLLIVLCNWPMLDSNRMKSITQFNMGAEFELRGDDARAANHYERTITLNPDDFDARMNLGAIYMRHGNPAAAEMEFRAACELIPELPFPHFHLANVYVRQRRLREAIGEYETVVRLLPDFPQGHLNLGVAWLELGSLDQAEASFRRAIDLDSDYAQARVMLANVLADLGKRAEALSHYNRALKIDPRHAAARSARERLHRAPPKERHE